MSIFMHAEEVAIGDYHYYFHIGDYYRLPIRAVGNLNIMDADKSYIRTNPNFTHNVCTKITNIVKKTVHTSEYALVIFEINTYEPIREFIQFFMEFTNHDGVSVDEKISSFQVNHYYNGDITFYLDVGLIETVVYGLWNNLSIDEYVIDRPSPFWITRIEKILTNDGQQINNIRQSDRGSYVIELKSLYKDKMIEHTLDYYEIDHKIEMKGFGSFRFGLLYFYMESQPEYIAHIDDTQLILTEISKDQSFEYAIEKISKDIWVEEGYAITADYEGKSFSFCKVDLPICGWDEDQDVINNILVKYTDPFENITVTMTNIEELQEFVSWKIDIEEKYRKFLSVSKKNKYKFTWK